jgi:chitin synthase
MIVDILGVDPKFDPEPLLFKSVGDGSKAAKCFSRSVRTFL